MMLRAVHRFPLILAGAGALAVVAFSLAQRQQERTMDRAVARFLATLTAEQRAKAVLPFNSEERLNFNYVPMVRPGIWFKDLSPAQRAAALQLLRDGLSAKGYQKVEAIRALETVLHEIEQGRGPVRDPELYYITVFGEPSQQEAWGWRYEGHHISLNWTSVGGKIVASTPQFLGSNPAEVREGPMRGARVLAAEEDLGRALIRSLNAEQRKQALLSDTAPPDLITSNRREAAILEDRGITYQALNREQQGILLALIREHASVQRPELARQRLEAIRRAGLNTIRFAWMGGLEKGQGHYYRVQGKTFLIEYDNTQNDANHIHTVWRDFRGDFGRDFLAEHYHRFPAPHQH